MEILYTAIYDVLAMMEIFTRTFCISAHDVQSPASQQIMLLIHVRHKVTALNTLQRLADMTARPHHQMENVFAQKLSGGSVVLTEYKVYGILKAAAFLGRAQQFLQMGDDVKALVNAQLGLQIAPAFPGVTSCLLDALWRLGRKKEAASQWRRFQSQKESLHQQWEVIRGDLPLYLSVVRQKEESMDTSLKKELEDYIRNEENKVTTPGITSEALKT